MYESDCPRQARIVQEREINDVQKMEQEKSVLRWGGLAGIVGGILLVAVFVIVGVFVGAPPAEPAGSVMIFPRSGRRTPWKRSCTWASLPCGPSIPRLVSCSPRDEPGARYLR